MDRIKLPQLDQPQLEANLQLVLANTNQLIKLRPMAVFYLNFFLHQKKKHEWMIFCYIVSLSTFSFVSYYCPLYFYHKMYIVYVENAEMLWYSVMNRYPDARMGQRWERGGECYNGHTMCSHWQKENNIFPSLLFIFSDVTPPCHGVIFQPWALCSHKWWEFFFS